MSHLNMKNARMTSARMTNSRMTLNCDLGEGDLQADKNIMPYIDKANIACGGHAGDKNSMQHAVDLALKYGVAIGAHPSYPDKANFGRVTQQYTPSQLSQSLLEQIQALDAIAKSKGASLTHIKPHGALYNDAMQDSGLQNTLFALINKHFPALPVVVQAVHHQTRIYQTLVDNAKKYNIALIFEAFADRRYTDTGLLQSRTHKGAVLCDTQAIAGQAKTIIIHHYVITHTGKTLPITAQTLCVHGDTPNALHAAQEIKKHLGHAEI